MVSEEYAVAYAEVLEILKYVSKDEVDKIPQNMIEMFKENSNKEIKFQYNCEKTLDEQNVSNITKTIIAILFRDYWATEEQREKIKNVQQAERNKKYDMEELFKKVNQNSSQQATSNLPVEIKEESVFIKIINAIKKIFRINRK